MARSSMYLSSRCGGSTWDAVVVGSGVGGAMAAHGLIDAGLRVLMIERGPRVSRGPDNWAADAALELSPYHTMDGHFRVRGDDRCRSGTFQCVGGQAVFYGGVSYRMREIDFEACPELEPDAGARWPYGYAELERDYLLAEHLLGVAGRGSADPLDPWRSSPYPHRAPDIQGPARRVWAAADAVGFTPTHLPLAIDFEGRGGGSACIRCGTCDGYACAVGAKRDPCAALLSNLEQRGLTVVPDTVAVRLLRRGGRVVGVQCVNRVTGRHSLVRGDRYVLAAGALGSPHLILASGLQTSSPARDWVGRCLMRHCNGIVYGLFEAPLEGSRAFHKQVGLMDLYGGTEGRPRLGCIQSIHPPPPGLVRDRVPGPLKAIGEPLADRCTGLLVIAEDRSCRGNRVDVCRTETDRYGLARAIVTHRYTERDRAARRALARAADVVLKAAGARFTQRIRIKTFSHAVGTLRMGDDPRVSPLDGTSRFRGIENLWVTDASFMPRSAAVNPSLTIAANALRAARYIAAAAGVAASGAPVVSRRSLPVLAAARGES